MSRNQAASVYWQAKIWALLHDPALKALHRNMGREGGWQQLRCMEGWKSPKEPTTHSQTHLSGTWLKYVGLCDLIASASDRSTIGRLPANQSAISYDNQGLQLRHLLSGKPQTLQLQQWHPRITGSDRAQFLEQVETVALDIIREWEDPQKVFWWLWRCYIPALANALGDNSEEPCIHLLPAETRLPDASLWSHVTMTSALAGALAGHYPNPDNYPQTQEKVKRSRPYVATFSFTPVQDLIKASRKMRDFWAGSWLLHYLSAKVCWAIAQKYGPDTLLYPCLYAQPLIDEWILQKYPNDSDFTDYIKRPSPEIWEQKLLTAGFPNVIVIILPDNQEEPNSSNNPVRSAMKLAENTLKSEWKRLSKKALDWLQNSKSPGYQEWKNINPQTWDGWLDRQWQTYWVALPIGSREADLHQSPRQAAEYQKWIATQNHFSNPQPALFPEAEYQFLEAIFRLTYPKDSTNPETRDEFRARQPNLNVGSWWASIFDSLRFSLNAVKNARTWQLPTAFGPRSTISGLGPVVHPIYDPQKPDWATEGQTRQFWMNDRTIFDGIEELNSTEVVKRVLHQILLSELFPTAANRPSKIPVLYPDLSSGVAGWLRTQEATNDRKAIDYFQECCKLIIQQSNWLQTHPDSPAKSPWGIPWVARNHSDWLNPRLLNAGWLIEDYPSEGATVLEQKQEKQQELIRLRETITKFFPTGKNPTDWYVLAAGDGDSMSEWLKGAKLGKYHNYLPDALRPKIEAMPDEFKKPLKTFLAQTKRMGPSTHSALSRALLDFSNQLLPYLTEERYAGRLIYGGGDDVLAYTNLWEWDSWLWDIRQCFRGDRDPKNEFIEAGNYWHWQGDTLPETLSRRPLFTMGEQATISFGVVIANQSVPLAIALDHLWQAEKEAKQHQSPDGCQKDAVQVRVIYGNGNILKTTAKFAAFDRWRQLLNGQVSESAIFEQAAQLWSQHPAPMEAAIAPWTHAFCSRRDALQEADVTDSFQTNLTHFLQTLYQTTQADQVNSEVQRWLKLTAFILRSQKIEIP